MLLYIQSNTYLLAYVQFVLSFYQEIAHSFILFSFVLFYNYYCFLQIIFWSSLFY